MKIDCRLIFVSLLLFVSAYPLHAQWIQTNGPGGGRVICLAAVNSDLFVCIFGGGLFHSTDKGTSWTAANAGMTGQYVSCVVAAPNESGGTNLFAGTYGGVFISTNYGTSWTAVNSGLGNHSSAALAISTNEAGGTILFTGGMTGGVPSCGVYRSTDSGKSWILVNSGLPALAAVTALVASGKKSVCWD
jgi:hypothetical protein